MRLDKTIRSQKMANQASELETHRALFYWIAFVIHIACEKTMHCNPMIPIDNAWQCCTDLAQQWSTSNSADESTLRFMFNWKMSWQFAINDKTFMSFHHIYPNANTMSSLTRIQMRFLVCNIRSPCKHHLGLVFMHYSLLIFNQFSGNFGQWGTSSGVNGLE